MTMFRDWAAAFSGEARSGANARRNKIGERGAPNLVAPPLNP